MGMNALYISSVCADGSGLVETDSVLYPNKEKKRWGAGVRFIK